MYMDTDVLLTTMAPGMGATAAGTVTAQATVRCKVDTVGSKLHFSAAAAGVTLEKSLLVWADDYKGYTHARLPEEETLRIANTGPGPTPLLVRLNLTRG